MHLFNYKWTIQLKRTIWVHLRYRYIKEVVRHSRWLPFYNKVQRMELGTCSIWDIKNLVPHSIWLPVYNKAQRKILYRTQFGYMFDMGTLKIVYRTLFGYMFDMGTLKIVYRTLFGYMFDMVALKIW
jgi:hypothetical protein